MHSRYYLQADDFGFERDGREQGIATALAPHWSAGDRIAFVAPDPVTDLPVVGGFVLAFTHLFYARPEVRNDPDFFDYPSHYLIGGEGGADPAVLGPMRAAPWTPAWCRLDVWPSTHHVVADPDPAMLMAAVLMLEPDVLVWPARLPCPASLTLSAGLPSEVGWRLLRHKLRCVWLYGQPDAEAAIEDASWGLVCRRGTAQLLEEAAERLPRPAVTSASTQVTRMAVDRFLA